MDNFLVEMMAHIEQQCSDVEKECSLLRKLLKPWPKKKQLNVENQSQVKDVKKSDECEKEENGLTPNEKIALEQVDRLIGKAQKALKIKEKVMVTERSCVAELESNNLTETKNDNNNVIEDKSCHTSKTPECSGDEGKTSSRKSNVHGREKARAEKKEISLVKKNQAQSRFTSASSDASHISSRSTTPRPLSATSQSRPSSSKSRYTPAHIYAPFKTDVNTRVPHRKLNHFHKNHLNKPPHQKGGAVTTQKKPTLTNGLKKLPKITSTMKEKETFVKEKDIFCGSNQEEKEIELDQSNNDNKEIEAASGAVYTRSVVQASADAERIGIITNQTKQLECVEDPVVPSLSEECVLEMAESRVGKQEAHFSLKDKGSKIKVPPKLGKLVAENYALSEKCSTAKLVKKVPDADVAQNFIDRLNAQNDVSQELWARAKAMSCLQSHHLMLTSLHSLEIDNLTENASFETIYRTKRLLEFILSIFAQTQEEADYFSRVQFRCTQSNGASQTVSPCDDFIKSLFSNQDNKSSKHQRDRFVKAALESTNLWTHLQFERDLHELQLHLLSLTTAEWWDILSSHPEHRIFQMVHGLLTSSGEFFPAIVENPYIPDQE